jgi:hypothetical protein
MPWKAIWQILATLLYCNSFSTYKRKFVASGKTNVFRECLFRWQRDGKIDKDELQAQYEALGYKPRKQTEYGISEVEDVIWEVGSTKAIDAAQRSCWEVAVH